MSAASDLEQEQLILDSVGRFLDREVKPYVHALEHDDIWPADIVEGMKALGLFGATIGADYGGLGLSASTYAKIVETVSTVWMSLMGRSPRKLRRASNLWRRGPGKSPCKCRDQCLRCGLGRGRRGFPRLWSRR